MLEAKSYTPDFVGSTVEIPEGTYEVVSYTDEGASHSEIEMKVTEPIEGIVIAEVYPYYNIVVENEHNEHTVIMAYHSEVRTVDE